MASFIKLTDHLGSVYALTDSQGRIAAQYRYDEFGIPVKTEVFTSRPLYNPLGYTGEPQHNDPAELIYLRQRYYAPQWGRFLSRDPIYISPVFNYTGNNPLRFNDPSGLDWAGPAHSFSLGRCEDERKQYAYCFDTCVNETNNIYLSTAVSLGLVVGNVYITGTVSLVGSILATLTYPIVTTQACAYRCTSDPYLFGIAP